MGGPCPAVNERDTNDRLREAAETPASIRIATRLAAWIGPFGTPVSSSSSSSSDFLCFFFGLSSSSSSTFLCFFFGLSSSSSSTFFFFFGLSSSSATGSPTSAVIFSTSLS